jgi:hypothetical protein
VHYQLSHFQFELRKELSLVFTASIRHDMVPRTSGPLHRTHSWMAAAEAALVSVVGWSEMSVNSVQECDTLFGRSTCVLKQFSYSVNLTARPHACLHAIEY